MQRKTVIMVISAMLVILSLSVVSVSAHEGREVGDYILTFGWRVEPALVGVSNGPELAIAHHDDHEDGDTEADHAHSDAEMLDVDVSLQVEVTFGPASRIMDLRPVFDEPGNYVADLIPTRPGDYSFRIFGTIGDLEVDETFTSSDGEFSSVEPASDVLFPDDLPSTVDLLARIETLEARVAELSSN